MCGPPSTPATTARSCASTGCSGGTTSAADWPPASSSLILISRAVGCWTVSFIVEWSGCIAASACLDNSRAATLVMDEQGDYKPLAPPARVRLPLTRARSRELHSLGLGRDCPRRLRFARDLPAERGVSFLPVLAKQRIIDVPYRGIDRCPVPLMQELRRQRKDRPFFLLHMAAEIGNVGAAGHLDVLAGADRPVDNVVEGMNQGVSAFLQTRVLLAQLVDDRTDVHFALLDPYERQILLGVMQYVGVMRHV